MLNTVAANMEKVVDDNFVKATMVVVVLAKMLEAAGQRSWRP